MFIKQTLLQVLQENGRNKGGIIRKWVEQPFGLPAVQSITLKYCRGKQATGLKDCILENSFLNGNPVAQIHNTCQLQIQTCYYFQRSQDKFVIYYFLIRILCLLYSPLL